MLRRAPITLLGAAMVASGTLLISFATHLTFVRDSWELLVHRQELSPEALLDPFEEHLILGPAIVYKLLLGGFGMDSALPFFVVSVGLFLLSVGLLYAYLRRRVGDWLALAGCLPILFLGAASEDLLWEFQITFFGSVSTGLGMLIALDREDRRGDLWACPLLLLSLVFSGVGVAFGAAALADLAFGRKPRRKRAFVTVVPLAAFLAWWVGWVGGEGNFGIDNLLDLPSYVFEAMAAGLSSLLGARPMTSDGGPPLLSKLLLIVLLAAGGVQLWRNRTFSRGMAVALTLAFAFWALTGIDRTSARYPTSSRYQYPSAVFILLVAAEFVARPPRSRLVLAAAAVVSAASVAGGLSLLQREYETSWRPTADAIRSTLGAVDLAGTSAHPSQVIPLPTADPFTVAQYASARARHGSPGFSEAELARRPNSERQLVDKTMATVLDLRLEAFTGRAPAPCRLLPTEPVAIATLRPGRYVLKSLGGRSGLWLGRFAEEPPVELGTVPAGATRSLLVPADRSPRPWRLTSTDSPTRICG